MEKNQLKFILVGALLGLAFALLLLAVGILGALVITLFMIFGGFLGYYLWKTNLLGDVLSKIFTNKQ